MLRSSIFGSLGCLEINDLIHNTTQADMVKLISIKRVNSCHLLRAASMYQILQIHYLIEAPKPSWGQL